jgi:uncharacterized membrane protein
MKKWLKKQTDFGFRKKAPWHFNLMIAVIVITAGLLSFFYDAPTLVLVGLGLAIGLLYRTLTKGKYIDQINGQEEDKDSN